MSSSRPVQGDTMTPSHLVTVSSARGSIMRSFGVTLLAVCLAGAGCNSTGKKSPNNNTSRPKDRAPDSNNPFWSDSPSGLPLQWHWSPRSRSFILGVFGNSCRNSCGCLESPVAGSGRQFRGSQRSTRQRTERYGDGRSRALCHQRIEAGSHVHVDVSG